ncbi:MAG: RdgB/HAM1 family non-canonical purine NTP pyrophosphatase [Bacteroidota bacterium]
MKKLLIATSSQGKIKEIASLLKSLPLQVASLAESGLPKDFEVEEPATTFEGNAIIKAMTLGKRTGLLTLADDSGLEVEALDGRPGVYSKRFAPGTDTDRNQALLRLMQNKKNRHASFRTVIAIYNPQNDLVRICEGLCPGAITHTPKGIHGFGYDPIFFSHTLHKTLAEATLEEKNKVSHRSKALKKASELLIEKFI